MPTPEDFEFLETEIGLMRCQVTEMLAHLDALQAQVDSARECLSGQDPVSSNPRHNPVWREALLPTMPAAPTVAAPAEPQTVSWEIIFCSSVIVSAAAYYLMLFLPHLVQRMR